MERQVASLCRVGLLAVLAHSSCGATVVRTAKVPGRVPIAVKMPPADADRVDALLQADPGGTANARCDFWRKSCVELPADAGGAREFCSHQTRGWCAKADAEIVGEQKRKEERAAGAREANQRKAAQQVKARQDARREALTKEELETGKCHADRHTQFQQVALGLPKLMERVSSGNDTLFLRHHAVIVATPKGAKFNLTQWLGGELHVFAIGFESVSLTATDPSGYAINLRSPYEAVVKSQGGEVDSVVMQTNAGSSYEATVTGKGCVLVAVFKAL